MLKKARQRKHGRHPTILSRWYADEEHRKPSSAVGWKEHHIMLCDRIAVEKHIYIATRAERIQNRRRVSTVHTNIARAELHSMITFHPELQSSGLHIFVSLKPLSRPCHVSFFAAPDTDHQHKFSLTHCTHFSCLSDGVTFAHKPYDASTQIPSLTGYEPESVENKAFDTEAIEPIRIKDRKDS